MGLATFANRNEKLERDIDYLRAAPFTVKQEGFWLGGPIIKDKLLFSVAPEWQQQKRRHRARTSASRRASCRSRQCHAGRR